MLAEEYASDIGARQQLGQNALTLKQRAATEIEAVEIKQIKRVIEQAIGAAGGEISMKRGEVRHTMAVNDHHLSIGN
jgi:hypothetical protein